MPDRTSRIESVDDVSDPSLIDDGPDPWANVRKYPRQRKTRLRGMAKPSVQIGRENRASFLNLVRNGRGIAQSCREMKMSLDTYYTWRKRFPDFAAMVDAARGGHVDPDSRWAGDFTAFRKIFLGFDTYFHQQKIVQAIEDAPPQSVTMVLVPPEFGKTTVMEDWITYKICTRPNVRITVVSEGQPHARKILRRVKARLSDRKSELWATFGPFYEEGQEKRGKPWSSDFFTVCLSTHDERDHSVEARGWTSAVAGTRCDYLIVDDVTSRRNHGQATTIVETLRQDFFTRPGNTGHTLIVGTRVDVNDVYERLMEAVDEEGRPLVSSSVVLPAVDDEGAALCPEMWSTEQLQRKRAIVGEQVWWRNYQQKPRAAADLSFTPEITEKIKNRFAKIGDKLSGGHTIIGLDPALGGGNALVVWSYTDKVMRVIDVRRDMGLARTEEIYARIDELCNIHGPVEDLVVESNAFQRALAGDDRMKELASKHGFRVLPHLTGSGGHSKLDEALGVASMATDMTHGELEIVWGDESTRRRMEALLAELHSWRPSVKTRYLRQDMVMAMWFGWIVMRQRRKVLATLEDKGWKMARMPFAPTDYLGARG